MLSVIAVAAFAGLASAWGNSSAAVTGTGTGSSSIYTGTTTEVVTSYTTYCPSPTHYVEGNKTYTVTSATVLTITDCPCTLTKTTTGPAHPFTTTITNEVSEYTTVCPSATEVTEKDVTYTATAGETITVENCPCKQETTTVVTPGVPATSTTYYTTTTVVSSYTTVCPSSTVLTIPGPTSTATYTATPKETVTVTNGPFTHPTVVPTAVVYTPGPAPVESTPAAAPTVAASVAPVPPQPSATSPIFPGAAAKISVGFSLGGAFGLLAYFL